MCIQREDVVSSLFCLAQVTCKQARGFPTFIRRITIIHRIDCNMPFLVSGICCSCNEPVEITPAHAGLTQMEQPSIQTTRDHPRACVAYSAILLGVLGLWGSPPRMRGLLEQVIEPNWGKGITPAHAGLTLFSLLGFGLKRDHPRACGAYLVYFFINAGRKGSPPRMRGLLVQQFKYFLFNGITPAHAGLTPS